MSVGNNFEFHKALDNCAFVCQQLHHTQRVLQSGFIFDPFTLQEFGNDANWLPVVVVTLLGHLLIVSEDVDEAK